MEFQMIQIKVKEGLTEFQEFLKQKSISHKKIIQESTDFGFIIEIMIPLAQFVLLLLELQKLLAKEKKEKVVILNINNININVNRDSEEEIKQKLQLK